MIQRFIRVAEACRNRWLDAFPLDESVLQSSQPADVKRTKISRSQRTPDRKQARQQAVNFLVLVVVVGLGIEGKTKDQVRGCC